MSTELIEPELGRDCERGLCETAPFLGVVCDLADPAREGENSRRRDRDRVAGESLGVCEVLEDAIVLAAIPEDAREVRLRLGCVLGVARGEQGVTRNFERVLLPRLVVAWCSATARRNSSCGRSGSPSGQSPNASSYSEAAAAWLLRPDARSPASRREKRARSIRSSVSAPLARARSSAERQWNARISA